MCHGVLSRGVSALKRLLTSASIFPHMGLQKSKISFRFTTTKCLDQNAAVLSLAVSLITRPTPTGYRLVLNGRKGEMFEENLGPLVYQFPICAYVRFGLIHNLLADLPMISLVPKMLCH